MLRCMKFTGMRRGTLLVPVNLIHAAHVVECVNQEHGQYYTKTPKCVRKNKNLYKTQAEIIVEAQKKEICFQSSNMPTVLSVAEERPG